MILAQVFESTLPRTSHNVAGGSARILSEEIPVSEEQPEDTTKEPSASDGRTISIKCPAHAAKAIFSFAQALTPDTKLVDSVLILPEEYKQAVKTFIEVIL